jgi:hypothetical protein
MTHNKLKPGDRVRVTPRTTVPGNRPGDKGTVLVGPIMRGGGRPYYIVAMDDGGHATTNTIFSAEEIEPDV